MKYTIIIRYVDGSTHTREVSDRHTAFYILKTEYKICGKLITNSLMKGVRV